MAALAFGPLPAYAGAGITLETASREITDKAGGPGGSLTSTRLCPAGSVMTGINYQIYTGGWRDPKYLNRLQAICSSPDNTLQLVETGTSPEIDGSRALSEDPSITRRGSARCNAGQVVTGVGGYEMRYPGSSSLLRGLQLECAPLAIEPAGRVRFSFGLRDPNAASGMVGMGTGNPQQVTDGPGPVTWRRCPDNFVAGGMEGYTGNWVDAVKLVCYRIGGQFVTTRFDVTPAPASYAGFALTLSDASGAVRFAPTSTANSIALPMRAGSYATSTTVPAGYTQTGNTCSSSVNVVEGADRTCTVTVQRIAPNKANSTIQVLSDNQPANRDSVDILAVTLRDGGNHPIGNERVTFAEAAGVKFGGASDPGSAANAAVGSCTTDANGYCVVIAGTLTASTYSSEVMAGDTSLGSLTYKFRAGPVAAGHSSIAVTADNRSADGTAFDVLTATVKDTNDNPVPGATVTFAATDQVRLGAAAVNTQASCTTDANGVCSINATSTVAQSYSTQASVGATVIGTANYRFRAGPANAANSSITVTTDNQLADGTAADVLTATIRDAQSNLLQNAMVEFAATPNVRFGSQAANTAASCLTGSSGTCSVNATSTVARAYSTRGTVTNSNYDPNVGTGAPLIRIGYAAYSFVAGATSGARSGVRVVTNDAPADGSSADVLEALVRDRFDNPVAGAVVRFAAAGADVAFDGGNRGQGGACTTTAAGTCQVRATSVDGVGGTRSSRVTTQVGGVDTDLAGTGLSMAGATYGASPLAFAFSAHVPRLRIATAASNGMGSTTFDYEIDGAQPNAVRITVSGTASGQSAQLLGFLPARNITIIQQASTAWPDAPVGASCVDRNAADATATFGTLTANRLTIPADHNVAGADLLCTFVNTRSSVMWGRVFSDTGVGGGTANDGLANGQEPGVGGVKLTLTDCAAVTHASAVTDDAGRYRLVVPAATGAGTVCLSAERGAGRQSTGASVETTALSTSGPVSVAGVAHAYRQDATGDAISFAWPGTSGTTRAGLDFGSVPHGSLTGSQNVTGSAGGSVLYPHVFTAGTAGSVRFAVTKTVSTPAASDWTERVLEDPGCTRQLHKDARVLYPPSAAAQPMAAGQVLCVLLQQLIPVQAALGDRKQVQLEAVFTLANAPALSATYLAEDGTTVAAHGLSLVTEVRTASQPDSSFGASNQARPGDTVEYRVTYTNNSPTPIRNLQIHDTMPAYTSFLSALEGSTPASLTGCTKVTPASTAAVHCSDPDKPGAKGGELVFRFAGELTPGAAGTVLIQVVLD